MMNNLNNEYAKLLDYFNQQGQERKPPVKESPKKKEEKIEISDTKQLIEESKIHSHIPGQTFKQVPKSEGFDTEKFESMMRAKLIEEHKKIQSYERPNISVTELIGCLRQCYYVRMRYPVNLNKMYQYPYLYLIQKVGNKIHDVIQSLYNFTETEKTIVSQKFQVKGRVDGIHESFLYEIKSIDIDKFKNKYIKEHYLQAIIYAYILNAEYAYKIETITIIYVMRNLKRIVPFDLPVDHKLAESLLSRAPILKSALNTLQVPDPFGANQEYCKYCLYKKQCKEDKCNEIAQPFMRKNVKKKDPIKEEKDKKTAFLL